MWTEHRFISFDETPIFYRRLKPPSPARGIVILLHGLGEHGGRYAHVGSFLAENGLESVAPDLRGFGKSGGSKGSVRHFSDYHKDLFILHSYIVRNHRALPIFLLGHSFGGLIASSYLAFHENAQTTGLILSSPLFGISIHVPQWRYLLGILASYLVPDFSQSSRVRPTFLTHDEAILADYLKDPYIYQRISARLFREMVRMIAKRNQIAHRISVPTLIVQAGEDYVVSKDETTRFFNLLKIKDKELTVYDHFYHEILNEVGREKVISRINAWINMHLCGN